MSYTPTQWQTGDTITAEKLNNMESGIENANEPFIVTLTPTAADFSGAMDKTVSEIYEAWTAGKKIVFKLDISGLTSPGDYYYVECTAQYTSSDFDYPSFNAFVVNTENNMLVFVGTGTTSDPDKASYSAYSYTLSPAT